MLVVGKLLAVISRLGRAFVRDDSASPAVEFALVAPVFFGIVLATLQAATIFLVKAFFETAAEEGARIRHDQPDRVVDDGSVQDPDLH